MSDILTGGCLCGDLRWKAHAAPRYMGLCYCADCRKASGSGFIPFMGFDASALAISGRWTVHTLLHADGRAAVRNSCVICGGLVFGGKLGADETLNIYAGSLDDIAQFKPTVALFTRDAPDWVAIPGGLRRFETMPR
ncbi:MAG: aldehyde-activating protein [Alphaproteobacteria bacterium 64-11]|nr:GFA family protein [Alphaproteobacteria bacterium]OJU13613.1 MAG: aldehyde-activating protein [Alphaproteobacteria bacterium 64-11]